MIELPPLKLASVLQLEFGPDSVVWRLGAGTAEEILYAEAPDPSIRVWSIEPLPSASNLRVRAGMVSRLGLPVRMSGKSPVEQRGIRIGFIAVALRRLAELRDSELIKSVVEDTGDAFWNFWIRFDPADSKLSFVQFPLISEAFRREPDSFAEAEVFFNLLGRWSHIDWMARKASLCGVDD